MEVIPAIQTLRHAVRRAIHHTYYRTTPPRTTTRYLHMTPACSHWLNPRKGIEEASAEMVVRKSTIFEEVDVKQRNKETFHKAVLTYLDHQKIYRRNHTEFALASLEYMKMFGVHRDLASYKVILSLFPQGPMRTTSFWQVEMQHYPKQQQCVIDIINEMEHNGVTADDEFGNTLVKIFGDDSHALRRYRKHMYWMPKFKHANPFPVPFDLPDDEIELAKMALKRMAVDYENEVSVYKTVEIEKSQEDTFIASAISPTQRTLIEKLPTDKSVYVEGGYATWLRSKCLYYFVLRADTAETHRENERLRQQEKEKQELFDWSNPMFKNTSADKTQMINIPTIHEQPDGTILAMCITGTSTKQSLVSWLSVLELSCPNLAKLPVLFTIRTPDDGIKTIESETDRWEALKQLEAS